MTQNLLRSSGLGANQAEMLRVADLVTNTSQEFLQQQNAALAAMNKQASDPSATNTAVTSADIRQIKMNYLQHNKNQLPSNGPVVAKTLDGKTGS